MKKLYKTFISFVLVTGLILTVAGTAYGQQQESLDKLLRRAKKAGIPAQELSELQDRTSGQGIDSGHLTRILQPAVGLAEADLPYDLVMQKAMEGLSKGIAPDRLIPVLEQVGDNTRQAEKIVGPWLENQAVKQKVGQQEGSAMGPRKFRSEMIKVSAQTLSQNVSPGAVAALMTDISKEDVISKASVPGLITAVGLLPSLPASDKNKGLSRAVIVRAIKNGFSSDELQKLPPAINMAQRRSRLPAASVVENVSKQLHNGVPASQILQDLFNGNVGGGPPGNVPPGLQNQKGHGHGNGNGKGNGNGHGH